MIDYTSGYTLPGVLYDPTRNTLVVKFEGTEYDWFSMSVKLGKRQNAQLLQYIEDMDRDGKVIER